jgi:hypothetical protein
LGLDASTPNPRPTPCWTWMRPPNPTLGLDATTSNSMLDLDASAQPYAQHIIIFNKFLHFIKIKSEPAT